MVLYNFAEQIRGIALKTKPTNHIGMKSIVSFLLGVALLVAPAFPAMAQHQEDARARELVSRMTLEEKCNYIGAARSFIIGAVPRLSIPEIRMADGPQGIRNNTISTLYPCGIMSASTWNRELVEQLGHALASDAKARGVAILLGPGVNIYRSPMCGRNYEYFGEDLFHLPQMHAFGGMLTVILQAGETAGDATLKVSGQGLRSATVNINVSTSSLD